MQPHFQRSIFWRTNGWTDMAEHHKMSISQNYLCIRTYILLECARAWTVNNGSVCTLFFQTEYDCDDATCIHPDLVCNAIRNCKFGWDEESCTDGESKIPLDLSAVHVIVILIVLAFILLGMCTGMIWNFVRTLAEDKEEFAASREKNLEGSRATLGQNHLGIPSENIFRAFFFRSGQQ